jgi:hypothetical protein
MGALVARTANTSGVDDAGVAGAEVRLGVAGALGAEFSSWRDGWLVGARSVCPPGSDVQAASRPAAQRATSAVMWRRIVARFTGAGRSP